MLSVSVEIVAAVEGVVGSSKEKLFPLLTFLRIVLYEGNGEDGTELEGETVVEFVAVEAVALGDEQRLLGVGE